MTEPQTRTITHSASGTTCTVHDFGATVLSFKTKEGKECLFVSRKAKMDGSKAVRGGIPLVFPQFGQPDTNMPQHGFLRQNYWKASEPYETSDIAGIEYTLELKDVQNARGVGLWDESTELDCVCTYKIEIGCNKMTTALMIKNTSSSKAFDFQTLQHTYYLVNDGAAFDPSQCYVKGLNGYIVDDKITNTEYDAGEEPVVLVGNVDRVYNPKEGSAKSVDVKIGVGGSSTIQMKAIGEVDGKEVPVACVVWNPFKEKAAAMGDFDDPQYVDMICVEPGILNKTSLEVGKTATLTQTVDIM